MLLEFRMRNFRSFKGEAVLSMVASPDRHAEANVALTAIKSIPGVLRTAVLYGPNAGGKSNFVRGLLMMRSLVVDSAVNVQLGQTFNIQPFRLDREFEHEPTEFEVTFLHEGVRYQYGFTLTPDRIHSEWLIVYRTAKPQQWFSRSISPGKNADHYEFGSHLSGPRRVWQESTRPNALFLSTAIQLNSDQLRPVFDFLANKVNIVFEGQTPALAFTNGYMQRFPKDNGVTNFLNDADISIAKIGLSPRKGLIQQFQISAEAGFTGTNPVEAEILVPDFEHRTEKGTAVFELVDESEGTRRLYALAGPVLDIIREGHILVVDELDRSLHTLLVRRLIQLFQDPEVNKNGAQLIFTTHDTSLLNADLFRRDQVWFVEKDREQASTLVPLVEFSPRKNEALEKGYLSGRYGAIPILKEPA